MSDRENESDTDWTVERDLASWSTDRRRILSAIGTLGAASLAGCSQSADGGSTTGNPTDTMEQTTQTTQQTDDEQDGGTGIDPRFGFTATDPDQSPPVEPDHTVNLNFEFVEGRGEIPEFYFEPTGLAVEPGDTVKFNLATPHHNVNAYHPAFGYTRRVPDGVPSFSSPILGGGDYWLYTFEEEGVHDITCAPHEIFGMAGRIVVGSPTGPGAEPIGEAPGGEQARPPEFTAGLVLSDEAMAPENIAERGSVSWSDISDENKRLLVGPTEESEGHD